MKKRWWVFVGVALVGGGWLWLSQDDEDLSGAKSVPLSAEERVVLSAESSAAELRKTVDGVDSGRVVRSGRAPLPDPVRLEVSEVSIPEELHFLFGWGPDAGEYQMRSRRIHQLARDLSEVEVRALIEFLYMKPKDVGLSDGDYHATGDAVMEKIKEQFEIYSEYTDHLALIFYDHSYSEIWRDYCLQHIGSCYQRMDEAKRPLLRQLYEDALSAGNVMAGTALLAMKDSLGGTDISAEEVKEKAVAVAQDAGYRDSSRLTAMLLAAELGGISNNQQGTENADVLALAREVVGSKEVTAHFRTAALATIGLLGEEGDIALLQRYVSSSDIRLRMAAKAALEKVEKRERDFVSRTAEY